MKRYLLFAGMDYYAAGGWNDFKGDFDSVEELQEEVARLKSVDWFGIDWWHYFDTQTKTIVKPYGR